MVDRDRAIAIRPVPSTVPLSGLQPGREWTAGLRWYDALYQWLGWGFLQSSLRPTESYSVQASEPRLSRTGLSLRLLATDRSHHGQYRQRARAMRSLGHQAEDHGD